MKLIAELEKKDLYGKKVLLRVDFNIPISNGKVSEQYRIKANKKTIDFLISNGAIVALASHIETIESFQTIADQIKKILECDFLFIKDCIGSVVKDNLKNANAGDVFLLENVRKYEKEKKNNVNFAKNLAQPFDLYVNNAFSVSHRNHASVSAITHFLPSFAGILLNEEIESLRNVSSLPRKGKTLIMGGNKISEKLIAVRKFFDKAEYILVGGAFFEKTLKKNPQIITPKDYIISNGAMLDIGPKTIEEFTRIIDRSQVVIWNGPLGKIEDENFSTGTRKISEAIINSKAFSVVGGGDTIEFLEKNSLLDKFNYISTGGGAMLEFLAGNDLHGLNALGYE